MQPAGSPQSGYNYQQPGQSNTPIRTSGWEPAGPQKQTPGLVTAISVLTLVGGCTALLASFVWMLGSMCLWIPWVLGVVAGGMGIYQGSRMLSKTTVTPPSRAVSILFLCCILNCDLLTVTMGILTLVFMSNPEVKQYYQEYGVSY